MRRRSIRKVSTKVKPLKVNKSSRISPAGTRNSKNRPAVTSDDHQILNAEKIPITVSTPDLIKVIKSSINDSKPLSISRCGDGEMHLLKSEIDFTGDKWKKIHHDSICLILNRNKIKRCEIHNKHLPPERLTGCRCYLNDEKAMKWLKMMKSHVIESIIGSDYIGLHVPTKNQILYGISEKVLRKNKIDPASLNVIDSLFPRDYSFGSIHGFKTIVRDHPLHFVTSHVNHFYKNNIHHKLGNTITYTDISGARSYELRDKVKLEISKTDSKIILFAGGGGIKGLIPWAAKEHGKIAIDIGSIADAWGNKTGRRVYEQARYKHLRW